MKCPSCKDHSLILSERRGIEIDYCPECRGVWLDRGELDKIIEKSQAAPARPADWEAQYAPDDRGRDRDHDHRYPKYKRKKSFLAELFD